MDDPSSKWSTSFAAASDDAMAIYDRVIAKAFAPWGPDLIARVRPGHGAACLDVACGPGTITHVLAAEAGSSGTVTATDISPAMLTIGRMKPAAPDAAPIEWIEAPAAPLPLADDSFDVVTCQQGLQFFPDKVASLTEMRRVLRDDGVAGISFWTSVHEQLWHVLHDAVETVLGEQLASTYTGPFSLGADEAIDQAGRAGFDVLGCERVTLPAVIEGGIEAALDSLAASGIAHDVALLDADTRARLHQEAARIAQPYVDGSALRGTLSATVLLLGSSRA